MFGLFSPRPPLEVHEQAWVERHLNVLARRLGPRRMGLDGGGPVEHLLPSKELAGFGEESDAERFLAQIKERLGPGAGGLTIEWFDGDAGLATDRSAIPVPRAGLGDPATLAASLVRSACLRAATDDAPRELREIDLQATALGLGLFLANADAPDAASAASEELRPLTSRELGYALALLWHVRQEGDGSTGDPPWLGELRGDAAGAVAGGLKYLRKVGDARFTAESAARGEDPQTEATIRAELRHRRPARRLAAAWDAAQLSERESRTPAAESTTLSGLLDAARDRDPAVRAAACGALGTLCPPIRTDQELWDRCLLGLIAAADDPAAAVRAAALRGLAALPDLPAGGGGREELDRIVLAGLAARTPAVRAAAAAVVTQLPPPEPNEAGETDAPFAPAVLKALVGALVRCEDAEAAQQAETLLALHPDPAALAADRVPDEELRLRVLDVLGVQPLTAPDAA